MTTLYDFFSGALKELFSPVKPQRTESSSETLGRNIVKDPLKESYSTLKNIITDKYSSKTEKKRITQELHADVCIETETYTCGLLHFFSSNTPSNANIKSEEIKIIYSPGRPLFITTKVYNPSFDETDNAPTNTCF